MNARLRRPIRPARDPPLTQSRYGVFPDLLAAVRAGQDIGFTR